MYEEREGLIQPGESMEELKGKSVFGGIAIGRISVYNKDESTVKRVKIEDTAAEVKRFEEAKETAKEQLQALYEKALVEVGEVNAMIFDVHQMMLDDLDYVEAITHMIENQGINAEYAVAATGDNFSNMFAAMDDDYMKARAADVKDISNRVVKILQGKKDSVLDGDEPVILLADDLAPSETVQLDKSKVLAFVTRHGSTNSHTAILARTMNIPALIGVKFEENVDGKFAIVDGYNGNVYVEPIDDVVKEYESKKQEAEEKKRLLQELKGKENITLDGKKIKLYANIGGVADVASALQNDAEGIGLFRSEFLYLESNTFPTEEEQFQAYKTVAENMAGKKVIIRTLDIGADKQVDYFNLDKEDNPAMGYRAIRICLTQPEIFKTQLRAIFRASYYGNIGVMYPMIISVAEVQKIHAIVDEVKAELDAQGLPYGDVEQGIMIETPAAVMMSAELAKEVDFFSIGTNDLTQYTLAIDRQNPKLDDFYDSHHPAILRMIQMVIDNGHKEGCWVGICGELGADTTLTETFLMMGIDELSVSPSMIFPVRDKIRSTDTTK
jgi:phosphotransferase system enzyme I (PtsI)